MSRKYSWAMFAAYAASEWMRARVHYKLLQLIWALPPSCLLAQCNSSRLLCFRFAVLSYCRVIIFFTILFCFREWPSPNFGDIALVYRVLCLTKHCRGMMVITASRAAQATTKPISNESPCSLYFIFLLLPSWQCNSQLVDNAKLRILLRSRHYML